MSVLIVDVWVLGLIVIGIGIPLGVAVASGRAVYRRVRARREGRWPGDALIGGIAGIVIAGACWWAAPAAYLVACVPMLAILVALERRDRRSAPPPLPEATLR
jgi:hypothetical protein